MTVVSYWVVHHLSTWILWLYLALLFDVGDIWWSYGAAVAEWTHGWPCIQHHGYTFGINTIPCKKFFFNRWLEFLGQMVKNLALFPTLKSVCSVATPPTAVPWSVLPRIGHWLQMLFVTKKVGESKVRQATYNVLWCIQLHREAFPRQLL